MAGILPEARETLYARYEPHKEEIHSTVNADFQGRTFLPVIGYKAGPMIRTMAIQDISNITLTTVIPACMGMTVRMVKDEGNLTV